MDEEIKRRILTWEYMHAEKNLGALSGCQLDETIGALGLGDYMQEDKSVLEIGVGMGYVTRELYQRGYCVDAFDVSKEVLKKIISYSRFEYDIAHIHELPDNEYDIILCQNVVQHIPTPLLYFEMFHFLRSLKADGIMAVKSIATEGIEDTGDDPDMKVGKMQCSNSIGCFCRSVECFKKIVDRCGGIAELKIKKPCNVMIITEEHIFHIKKKYIYD